MPTRGNPYAIVRLEPHVMDMLQDKARPRQRGRGGGVSQYLRELVYAHLGLGEPACFGYPENKPPAAASSSRREPHAAPELT